MPKLFSEYQSGHLNASRFLVSLKRIYPVSKGSLPSTRNTFTERVDGVHVHQADRAGSGLDGAHQFLIGLHHLDRRARFIELGNK